jgi:hypothetical protein
MTVYALAILYVAAYGRTPLVASVEAAGRPLCCVTGV